MQTTPGTPLNEGVSDSAPDPRLSAARHIRLFVVTAVAAYLLDVLTKIVAMRELAGGDPVSVIGDVLTLRLTRNPGAAFSLGTSSTLLLTLVSIAVVIAVVWMSRRLGSGLWALALGLLLGGAAGNLTDRLMREPGPMRGHVVDFIELPYWPVFNFADSAIVVGAVLIVVQSLRGISLDGSKVKA